MYTAYNGVSQVGDLLYVREIIHAMNVNDRDEINRKREEMKENTFCVWK